MRLVCFYLPGAGTRMGLWRDSEVVDLTSMNENLFCCFTELLRQTYVMAASIEEVVNEQVEGHRGVSKHYEYSLLDRPPSQTEPHLLMPLKPVEVWGAGITYIRSRAARETETKAKGIYAWLYDAARPEIFFKATPSRCVGPNEAICIRSDSTWTVPEPELTFILGDKEDIIGFTAGNDVSCRDIEGENPLYLPQAKIYKGCCALGPSIATSSSIGDPRKLSIECRVIRNDQSVFEGKTNTSFLKRSLEELAAYLCRDNPVPLGTVFLTGTGIVPPDEFALNQGDIVEINIEGIGTLRNPVVQL